MTINNNIIEFERLCHKIKKYDMGLPDDVLAYKFSNNANISEHNKQLVRATLSELKYKAMKEQLKKVFCDPRSLTGSIKEEQNIKVKPISNTEDLYYGNLNDAIQDLGGIISITLIIQIVGPRVAI